jgi:hypothetical protein
MHPLAHAFDASAVVRPRAGAKGRREGGEARIASESIGV